MVTGSKRTVAKALPGLLYWSLLSSAAMADVSAFLSCRGIADASARLACYDAAADQGTDAPPSPSSGPESAPAPSAREAATASAVATAAALPVAKPTPEELFGRDAVKSDEIVREASGIGQLQEMPARVASVRTDSYGKLVLTLANGQVWSQIDSPAPRIRAGDEVLIRRAAMGSYLLIRNDGGRGIRVHRDR